MEISECCLLSDNLVTYVIGDISNEQKNFIERHLLSCAECSQEVKQLREAWNLIPYNLEEVEVPADLKEQVMNVIFESGKYSAGFTELSWRAKFLKLFAPDRSALGRWTLVALLLALVGLVWNNLMLREQLLSLAQQSQTTNLVVQTYTLKSAEPSNVSAKGNVWLFQQGNAKNLVFHIQGLAPTNGTEAYQVWLIHDGQRQSAGVFRVDEKGEAVINYEIKGQQEPFEAIGITLEPDAKGTQPRGKKVLGS